MSDVKQASKAIYRMILSKSVSTALLNDAADFFSQSETTVAPNNFKLWFSEVQKDLANQPELIKCGQRWQAKLAGRERFTQREAEAFQRDYLAALDMTRIMSQPILAGFAQRPANSQFDTPLSQPKKTTAWMMIATTDGEARVRSGLRDWISRPGEVLLFAPTAVYQVERQENCPEWRHYWFTFQATSDWQHYLDWPKAAPDVGRIEVQASAWPHIQACMQQLLCNFEQPSAMQTELNSNLLQQCLLHCNNQFPMAKNRREDERIRLAKAYISEHYHQDFTLQNVADAAHLSASRLAALFKQHTGISVLNWRDEKRLIKAAQLLRNSEMPIASIGEYIGMNDPTYFSRQFKKYVGSSPREYRQSGVTERSSSLTG